MGIRIRHLELLAMTAEGPFGVRIPFENGLTVISAPNTSGKSTCSIAILYALGLEGMLSPSHTPPFPAAMMDKLLYGDKQLEVVSSQVRLEIENDAGEFATLQRMILASTKIRQLVRVEFGRAITNPGKYAESDYYVRTSGSATTDLGFHAFLAEFAGLDLPWVNSADGGRVPLYLECLFPYFFVEQISGWRDIKSRMPTYLRIPEMAKRSFEFILKFDVLLREVERQALLQDEQKLKQEWGNELNNARRQLQGAGAILEGIPHQPAAIWPPTPSPSLLVTDGQEWFPFNEFQNSAQSLLYHIRTEALPTAEQASETILEELRVAENRLADSQQLFEDLASDIRAERSQVVAIDERLSALREDMQNYQNAKRLEARTGLFKMPVAKGLCPTCNQPIKDALLPQDRPANPMSIEENLAFLRDQIKTFQEMRHESLTALEAKGKQLAILRDEVANRSAILRDHKRMLRSDAQAPSAAAIRAELQLEQRLQSLSRTQETFSEILSIFESIAVRWTENQAKLKAIASRGLSETDMAKLDRLKRLFLEQLEEYGFSSYVRAEIGISPESYRPTLDNNELGVTSASDAIRVIWAYLLGILEVARSSVTNHIGFLVFDEPKQQSAADLSFDALLKRAATSKRFGQQVICATSEKRERLDTMLEGLDCQYIKFDGKMLKPLS